MSRPRNSRRYWWITLGVVLALAAAVWGACYHFSCDRTAHAAARDGDVMTWMRHEFCLSDSQYTAILQLHEEHSVVCAQHCADVRAARQALETATARGEVPAVAIAAQELRRTEEVCRTSTEAHVRRVAAKMDPAAGVRYLAMVLPRLSGLDHKGPPSPSLDR